MNQRSQRAFEMAFIIGQKSYEGYEYYDFFEQVFQRLKGNPFRSNLTSVREVSPGGHHIQSPNISLGCTAILSLQYNRRKHKFICLILQVSPYSAYLHDAVLLYAMGLKETIKDGKDPKDGRQLLKRLKNKNNIRFYGWFWGSCHVTHLQSTEGLIAQKQLKGFSRNSKSNIPITACDLRCVWTRPL